jgi:hypothetical protein
MQNPVNLRSSAGRHSHFQNLISLAEATSTVKADFGGLVQNAAAELAFSV